MPLHDATGQVPDPWVRVGNGQEPPEGAKVILSLDRLSEEGPPADAASVGVHMGAAVDVRTLEGLLETVALVSIEFASFGDGRGFSQARRLRAMGFRGELRAFGPVIADQFGMLLAVGFDAVEIPEAMAARQPAAQWAAAREAVKVAYQPGFAGRVSILEARRAARGAA